MYWDNIGEQRSYDAPAGAAVSRVERMMAAQADVLSRSGCPEQSFTTLIQLLLFRIQNERR